MYFISYADILFWALKLSYPSDFLPAKTPFNRHVSSDLHETVLSLKY